MNDKVKVTVIATGLGCDVEAQLTELKTVAPATNRNAVNANAINVANNAPVNAAINTLADTAVAKANVETETASSVASLHETAAVANNNANANLANANNNNAGLTAANANANNGDSPELARAREIARRLGMINNENQDFDVPAFMRRANEAGNDA
jgi:hypothetical protein